MEPGPAQGAPFRPAERGFCGLLKAQPRLRRITLKVQRDGRSFTVLNYRTALTMDGLASEAARQELQEFAFRAEPADGPQIPIEELSVDALDQARRIAMLSLVKHWGLEPRNPPQTSRRSNAPRGALRLLVGRYAAPEPVPGRLTPRYSSNFPAASSVAPPSASATTSAGASGSACQLTTPAAS